LGTGELDMRISLNIWRWSILARYPQILCLMILSLIKFMQEQIYSDAFFVEPCGIGQLIAMRYGCLPIVRETGGLQDTVQAYNQYMSTGSGFSLLTIMLMKCLTPLFALYCYLKIRKNGTK